MDERGKQMEREEGTRNERAIAQEKTPRKAWGMLAVVYFASFVAPLVQFKTPPLASFLIPAFGMDGVTFGMQMSVIVIQFMQNAGTAIGPTIFGAAMESMGWADAGNFILLPMCAVADRVWRRY